MNEFQYNLVKTFLKFPLVTPQKLARSWKIDLNLVKVVDATTSYGAFKEMPEEDLLTFFGGKSWK